MNPLKTIEVGVGNVKDLRFDVRLDIQETPAVTDVGDMCDLSRFADNTFCLLKTAASTEHLTPKDQQRAVKEWRRVLVNNGIVVIQTPDKGYWEQRLESEDQHEREWANIQMHGGERDEYDHHLGLLSAEDLQALFEGNGYETLYLRDGNQAAGSLDAAFCVTGK